MFGEWQTVQLDCGVRLKGARGGATGDKLGRSMLGAPLSAHNRPRSTASVFWSCFISGESYLFLKHLRV